MSKSLLFTNFTAILSAYLLYCAGVTPQAVREWRTARQPLAASPPAPPPAPALAANSSGGYVCDQKGHRMQPHFLSYDPIMVYIENFMTPFEAQHMRNLASPLYAESLVENPDHGYDEQFLSADTRRSQTAWLPSADPVVACVRQRALDFQGFEDNDTMDSLAAVKYGAGGEFTLHYDYHFQDPVPVDRRTSFFAILDASADLVGGSTFFPGVGRLAWNSLLPGTWCRFIECGNPQGLFIKPVVGYALFWVNFREDGTGHEGTVHAGAPVVEGTKVGLNIWTYDRMW